MADTLIRNLVGEFTHPTKGEMTVTFPLANATEEVLGGVHRVHIDALPTGDDDPQVLYKVKTTPLGGRITDEKWSDLMELRKLETADRVDHSQHFGEDGQGCGHTRTWKTRISRDVAMILDRMGVPEMMVKP